MRTSKMEHGLNFQQLHLPLSEIRGSFGRLSDSQRKPAFEVLKDFLSYVAWRCEAVLSFLK
jgi:hypothetical protein